MSLFVPFASFWCLLHAGLLNYAMRSCIMCKVRQNFETSTGLLLDIIPSFFTRGVRDDSDSGLVATFPRCAPLYAIPFTLLRTNVCRWFDERFVAHEALMSFTRRVPQIITVRSYDRD